MFPLAKAAGDSGNDVEEKLQNQQISSCLFYSIYPGGKRSLTHPAAQQEVRGGF